MKFDKNLVLLLLMNIIIDATYSISGIYTNFCTFLHSLDNSTVPFYAKSVT